MSVIKELRSEIARVARREIKKELDPIKRVNASQRKYIADLRRELADVQKEIKRLQKESDLPPAPSAEEEEAAQNLWISGKGVLSLRKRLGLTQAEFAQLAGASVPSVVKWEKIEGKVPFRSQNTLLQLQELRSLGKKEAWEKLGKEQ